MQENISTKEETILDKPPTKRLRNYLVSPEMLPLLFKHEQCFLTTEGIPEDAEFRGFGIDGSRNLICCLVEHPSYDEVETGKPYPEFSLKCKRIYYYDEDRDQP